MLELPLLSASEQLRAARSRPGVRGPELSAFCMSPFAQRIFRAFRGNACFKKQAVRFGTTMGCGNAYIAKYFRLRHGIVARRRHRAREAAPLGTCETALAHRRLRDFF